MRGGVSRLFLSGDGGVEILNQYSNYQQDLDIVLNRFPSSRE